jgi:hypothetical protein
VAGRRARTVGGLADAGRLDDVKTFAGEDQHAHRLRGDGLARLDAATAGADVEDRPDLALDKGGVWPDALPPPHRVTRSNTWYVTRNRLGTAGTGTHALVRTRSTTSRPRGPVSRMEASAPSRLGVAVSTVTAPALADWTSTSRRLRNVARPSIA